MPAESAFGNIRFIKNYQRQHFDTDHGVDGWLQAKNEISHLIDESLKLKRTRTHKRIARYRETAEQVAPKAEDRSCHTSNEGSD
jgi:hypothetical protein